MKKVIVTGGLGALGQWVVDYLAKRGWNVTCVDIALRSLHPGWGKRDITFRAVDLTDQGETWELVRTEEPDAVVHLAGIPHLARTTDTKVFDTNVQTTHNMLVAAGHAGTRVVWSSSEAAYGTVFAAEPWMPDSFPIDEEHPLRPEDAYGLSKLTGEEIAKMIVRKFGVSIASIRASWVQFPGRYQCIDNQEPLEAGVRNFWCYVDVRDVASIIADALEADFDGHEAFNAIAKNNYLDRPTADAVAEYFGVDSGEIDLAGDEAAFSVAKAQRELDWEPEHTWQTAANEEVTYPDLSP